MKAFLPLLVLISLSAFAQSDKVIYGIDNRVDVYASTNAAFVDYARATAAKIPNLLMRAYANNTIFRTASLQERGVCAKERFSHQPTSAMCTGFLVSEKILVTAGHCILDHKDCQGSKWAFDYKADHAEQTRIQLPSKNLYACKKILARAYDHALGADYAVIELAKKVTDRRPLNIRRSGQIEVGTPLVVIGHPSSLPTKIADGATVRRLEADYFVADLDTFGGNSGSPVINVSTGEVEGILVRGEDDYVVDAELNCKTPKVCEPTACRGEDVQKMSNIPALRNL